MNIDIEDLLTKVDKRFEYRISKGGVLKIDAQEILSATPSTIIGAKNGNASIHNSLIYYSPNNDFIGQDYFLILTKENNKNIVARIDVDVVTTFKPKAHILILLGEELIRTPVMAIYELIKNSYDADSKEIQVKFENIENLDKAQITIIDYGTGITKEVLENVWFEPGSDFRKPIKTDGSRLIKRSPIYGRIPMGEKGVGRFAVHKLGHTIKLISRPAKIELDTLGKFTGVKLLDYEISVDIDWRTFSQSKYLDDVKINWQINTDSSTFHFQNTHGTYITIGNLKEVWTRGMARQLKRQTVSMLSPKNDPNKFSISLDFGNWWLNDFPEIDEILDVAPYKLSALVDDQYNMTFEYTFSLKNNPEIGSRFINKDGTDDLIRKKYETNIKEDLKRYYKAYLENKEYVKDEVEKLVFEFDNAFNVLPFGPLMIEMYSYDLDSNSIRDYSYAPALVRSTLKDHSGIKVFKRDLRVFDYGDPGNDWLGLDNKRINNKSWFSNNQNIGFVFLDDEKSGSLIEKTNREGFIKNISYDFFVFLLEYILSEFKAERFIDRNKWLKYNQKSKTNSFDEQLKDFKALINDADLNNEQKKLELISEADKIEERYQKDKSSLLIPAGVGMTASFAMHEIEKLVPRMNETVKETPINKDRITDQVAELKDYVEGILSIVKKGGNKPISLIDSINQAVRNYSSRLLSRNIKIEIVNDITIEKINCDKRLLITMLMNIIDNSIYWIDTIYKDEKSIYIKTQKSEGAISIIIADNGPGFKDSIEDIVTPFFTRKEGGIGIGMYLVDTIMIQYGRLNIIYDKEYLKDKDIPDKYNGAAVELIFSKLL